MSHVEDAARALARLAQDIDSVAGLLAAGALPILVARCAAALARSSTSSSLSSGEGKANGEEECEAGEQRIGVACAVALCNLSTATDRAPFAPHIGDLVALLAAAPRGGATAPLGRMVANLAASSIESKTLLGEGRALEAVHGALAELCASSGNEEAKEAGGAEGREGGGRAAVEELLGALATLVRRHGANAGRLVELGALPLLLRLLRGDDVDGCAIVLANLFEADDALLSPDVREELIAIVAHDAAAYRLSAVLAK